MSETEGAIDKKRVEVELQALLLPNRFNLMLMFVLVDEKKYFEIPWASLRSMVQPSFAERSVINHRDYFTNARLVTSTAFNITESEVLTAQDDYITYDYLVIATGHKDSFSRVKTERLSQYQAEYEKIKSSNSILIVGGGPTGVELDGEIPVDFPKMKLVLVHRGSRLLEFVGPKASKKSLDWLVSKKVEVILEQSVYLSSSMEGSYRLEEKLSRPTAISFARGSQLLHHGLRTLS